MTENPYRDSGTMLDSYRHIAWQEGYEATSEQRLRLAKENIRLATELAAERAEAARLRGELEAAEKHIEIRGSQIQRLGADLEAARAEVDSAINAIWTEMLRYAHDHPDPLNRGYWHGLDRATEILSRGKLRGPLEQALTTPPVPVSAADACQCESISYVCNVHGGEYGAAPVSPEGEER